MPGLSDNDCAPLSVPVPCSELPPTREDGMEIGPLSLLCVCSDPGHRQAVRDNVAALRAAGDEWAWAGRPLPEAVAAMRDEIARLRAECAAHERTLVAISEANRGGRQLTPFTPEA